MQHEKIGELHEITSSVRLTDFPAIETSKGQPMKPSLLTTYWVRENATQWELMTVEVKGKIITPKGRIGTRDGIRTYWCVSSKLPGWVGSIVDEITPVEVLIGRGEA